MIKLIRFITILFFIPATCYALTCPRVAKDLEPGIRELSLDTVDVKFETSGKISKMKLNGAFESSEWTFVDVSNGPGRISGYLQTTQGLQLIGDSVAVVEDGEIDWALFVIENPASEKGLAVVSINNSISCVPITLKNWKQSLADIFGANFYEKSSVKISDQKAVYENLGLN